MFAITATPQHTSTMEPLHIIQFNWTRKLTTDHLKPIQLNTMPCYEYRDDNVAVRRKTRNFLKLNDALKHHAQIGILLFSLTRRKTSSASVYDGSSSEKLKNVLLAVHNTFQGSTKWAWVWSLDERYEQIIGNSEEYLTRVVNFRKRRHKV